MSDLISADSGGFLSLLHGKGGGLAMPRPFERDIFLFDTRVAGTSHIVGMDELEPYLNVDDRLDFFREPDNPYDPLAIVIKNRDGVKLGYVPRRDNAVFARLMDAGKLLFGRIAKKEMEDDWLKLDIKIFLHE